MECIHTHAHTQVDLDPNAGIFITMNPAGKGYGGRQKLPDNLKQLFRPVAMSRPDNEQIAEVILFSEGFKEAKNIGRKLVAVFNLSKLEIVFLRFHSLSLLSPSLPPSLSPRSQRDAVTPAAL